MTEFIAEHEGAGMASVRITDAARLLDISPHGVRTAITRGRLMATLTDGQWRVTIMEIERYRLFHRHTQSSDPLPRSVPLRRPAGGWRSRGRPSDLEKAITQSEERRPRPSRYQPIVDYLAT